MTDTNSNPTANEKRLSRRRKFEVEGTLSSLTEGVQHPDHKVLTRNISADGVYLLTNTALPIDERVEIELPLPSPKNSKAVGTVVRMDCLPDGKVGLAIRLHGVLPFNLD